MKSLFNDILGHELLNILLASYFLINLDFLLPHIARSAKIIVLTLLVFEALAFILYAFFLHLNNKMTLFYI